MISKRLVLLIYNQIIDPWHCDINSRVSDMDEALDSAIDNDGYIDGIYFLKADHEIHETRALFPEYRSVLKMEVHGSETAICIGRIVSISVEKKWASIMIENRGKVHYVMLPTDSDDMRMSDRLITRRRAL